MNKNIIKGIALSAMLVISMAPRPLQAITTEDILQKVKETQERVTDFQAYYSQSVQSSLFGKTPIAESGRYFKKGNSIRKEIQRPSRKLIITTEKFTYEKDETTGQERKTDLQNTPQNVPFAAQGMTPEEALRRYSLSLKETTDTSYILTGQESANTVTLQINKDDFTTSKIEAKMGQGGSVSITMTYENVDGIKVLKKTTTKVAMAAGTRPQEINVDLEYKSIKVNQGLREKLFKIK